MPKRGGPSPGTAPGTIALTGTPGVGKKTVAPFIAKRLGMKALALNSLARGRKRKDGEVVVDPNKLRSDLMKLDLTDTVVFGHLVPDVLRKRDVDFVAVLRCEPEELKKRLIARGYPSPKVIENVEAELIGVVLDSCIRSFGEDAVHEYDTTKASPRTVAQKIAAERAAEVPHVGGWVDWTLDYDSPTKLRSLLSSARTDPAST
jgi:adenylate kinase